MTAMDFHKTRQFFNLAVGNSKRFNCKVQAYKGRISTSIITVYLVVFALGIFVGDISSTAAISIENVISMVSTVTIAGLGSAILYDCWRENSRGVMVSAAVVSIMIAQIAYIFNLFSLPIVNSLFEMASIVTMVILYGVSQNRR